MSSGGARILGVAGRLTTNDPTRVIIDEITPLPNLSGVTTVGSEASGGTAENWTVTSHAICATV